MSGSRLISVDVFRGLTILFMIIVNTPGSWEYVYSPLRHAAWHGCTTTDLVFPFFLFIVGVSMACSWSKNSLNKRFLISKIIKRSLLIFLVGFLLTWFPFFNENLLDVRVFNVLQRIGLSFGCAGLLLVFIKNNRLRILLILFLLVSYWLTLYLGGDYSLEGNINAKVDLLILPSKNLYGGFGIPFDPEGILGVVSSTAHIMIGFLIGQLLLINPKDFIKKSLVIGIVLVSASKIIDLFFPINKPLWTSSYVLFTCGLASMLLGVFVYLIEIKKLRRWTTLFEVYGLNPLVSYVLSGIIAKTLFLIPIGESSLYSYLYHSFWQPLLGNYNGSLAFAIMISFFVFIPVYMLFKKGKIIKL